MVDEEQTKDPMDYKALENQPFKDLLNRFSTDSDYGNKPGCLPRGDSAKGAGAWLCEGWIRFSFDDGYESLMMK
jgi:hypothetical protein